MTELKFEREACGRCGGCGRYSWCQMHGDTCFGCKGTGTVLTKRGKAAAEWLIAQRTVPVSQIKIGDRVRASIGTFTVRAIETEGGSKWLDKSTGEWRNHYTLRGQKLAMAYSTAEDKIEIIPATQAERVAQFQAAIEYQNSLTKAGKPRKVAA